MANSVDPDQTAPIGAVCSGSMLFASLLKPSVMLGNYLQQMTSADDIFRYIFFLVLSGKVFIRSRSFIHTWLGPTSPYIPRSNHIGLLIPEYFEGFFYLIYAW